MSAAPSMTSTTHDAVASSGPATEEQLKAGRTASQIADGLCARLRERASMWDLMQGLGVDMVNGKPPADMDKPPAAATPEQVHHCLMTYMSTGMLYLNFGFELDNPFLNDALAKKRDVQGKLPPKVMVRLVVCFDDDRLVACTLGNMAAIAYRQHAELMDFTAKFAYQTQHRHLPDVMDKVTNALRTLLDKCATLTVITGNDVSEPNEAASANTRR